ncbi:hypothetical protein [Vibrio harveyi]|uniref:hypothetical protein n=1 Tax=Vibrio harveyi TaxID=669 RepID=UPI0023803602|nr:hypothetical protein [Vibrio harveyi]
MTNKLIIGVGGAGTNIAHFLVESLNDNSELLLINSDKASLDKHSTLNRIFLDLTLSSETTKPKKITDIVSSVKGEILRYTHNKAHLVIVVGLGGETGSYSASSIVNIVNNDLNNVILIAVLPFHFESSRRHLAEQELSKLTSLSNIKIISFDNELLMNNKKMGLTEAFEKANKAILSTILN